MRHKRKPNTARTMYQGPPQPPSQGVPMPYIVNNSNPYPNGNMNFPRTAQQSIPPTVYPPQVPFPGQPQGASFRKLRQTNKCLTSHHKWPSLSRTLRKILISAGLRIMGPCLCIHRWRPFLIPWPAAARQQQQQLLLLLPTAPISTACVPYIFTNVTSTIPHKKILVQPGNVKII